MRQRYLRELGLLLVCACGAPNPNTDIDGTDRSPITSGSEEARAVLAVVNDPAVDFLVLDGDVGLDRRAARNITRFRNGDDGLPGTSDDRVFTTFDQLDAIPYVGTSALARLLDYAIRHGYVSQPPVIDRERVILLVVNDPELSFETYDDDMRLDRRAAASIWEVKTGADRIGGTADDHVFRTLTEVDQLPYVGEVALESIHQWGIENGYGAHARAVFSPRPYIVSHNAQVVLTIRGATTSLDVAIYSLSDEAVFDALEDAVARGVAVRVIFETASRDRTQTGAALAATRSARLEAAGIDVRWVNKVMHHKFLIADGPRDDLAAAATATLVTGSGNWSYGAATRYDEDTLFLYGNAELNLRFQREFDRMWNHSRNFVYDATLPFVTSSVTINNAEHDATTDAYFTSANFTVSGDTFRIQRGSNEIADRFVRAIEGATSSIWIASGHLRSRPIAEALILKHRNDPNVDIRVYLDGQEYISAHTHRDQEERFENCLDTANTEAQLEDCTNRGFYFGYQVGQSGIDVRYKHYAYRWHYSYAVQMHHKFMVIDGDELWTGSYNLSDNAEHNTFENVITFRGPTHAALVQRYVAHFAAIWDTGRDGTYDALMTQIPYARTVPLVYTPMALTHAQVTALKAAIRAACPQVGTAPFRTNPDQHRTCSTI